MTVDQVKAELCSISEYADRIVRCRELLLDPNLTQQVRDLVMYFLCHALRQPEVDNPDEALLVAEQALAGSSLTPDLWGKLAEARAMALYDLNRMEGLPQILDEIRDRDVIPSVRGHEIALRGMYLSKHLDPAAFVHLREAESRFTQLGHEYGCGWVQVSAASLAMKLGLLQDAIQWADKVSFSKFIPVAKLLVAEVLYREERVDQATNLVERVEAGEFGPLSGDMPARCGYLKALFAWRCGDTLMAGRHLYRAQRLLSLQRRQSIDLGTAMAGLRMNLLHEGVA